MQTSAFGGREHHSFDFQHLYFILMEALSRAGISSLNIFDHHVLVVRGAAEARRQYRGGLFSAYEII